MTEEIKKKQKSGSEKRRRNFALPPVRCTDEHRATVEEAANRAGLSLGSYILATVLQAKPLPSSKIPPIERQALAQVLGQLGRLNSNANQIAKAINSGGNVERKDLQILIMDLAAFRDNLRTTLGRGKRDN